MLSCQNPVFAGGGSTGSMFRPAQNLQRLASPPAHTQMLKAHLDRQNMQMMETHPRLIFSITV